MTRVLIVDDEALARRSVARQLAARMPEAEVREAKNGFEALDAIAVFAPELMFLDVEMPELSGIDLLRQLAPPRPKIVFVTAFQHFAVSAFEENACDYLVKPFTSERFAQALSRALAQLDAESRLAGLEQSLSRAGVRLERIALKSGARTDVVELARVSCLVSKGHYTYLYEGGREHLSELPLIHFEERLDPSRFTRAHRSALVNVTRIARIHDVEIELDDGTRVPLSRRNRAALVRLYRP